MMRRQRILNEDEIKSVWRASSDAGMFGVLVKMLLVTAQRRDDWAEARWSELSGLDGDYPLLTVPAARYKVGQTHEVPLPPLAVTLLRSLPRFAGSDWIFTINGTHPLSSFTRPKRKLDEASGVTGWTLHDLRRTGRTLMANLEAASSLRSLHQRFRLGVITNCDRDLFALSNRRLGVTFDWIVAAEDARVVQAEPGAVRARLRDDRRPARAHPAHRAEPLPRPRPRQAASD